MTKKNDLLEKAISEHIDEVRYKEYKKAPQPKRFFYLFVVFLLTMVVLISLFRYL